MKITSLLFLLLTVHAANAQKKTYYIDTAAAETMIKELIKPDDLKAYSKIVRVTKDSAEKYSFRKSDNSLRYVQVSGKNVSAAGKRSLLLYIFKIDRLVEIETYVIKSRALGRSSNNYYLFKDGRLCYSEENNPPENLEALLPYAAIYLEKSKRVPRESKDVYVDLLRGE